MVSLKYLDGTTDITRTVHFGKPTAHEKASYSAVCGVSMFHWFILLLFKTWQNFSSVFMKCVWNLVCACVWWSPFPSTYTFQSQSFSKKVNFTLCVHFVDNNITCITILRLYFFILQFKMKDELSWFLSLQNSSITLHKNKYFCLFILHVEFKSFNINSCHGIFKSYISGSQGPYRLGKC